MKPVMWTIADLVEIAQRRQANKFDCNIAVSGPRGNGKSTLLAKFYNRFEGFDPWKHQVYSRNDVIALLESQKFGFVFDDEAIVSAYKRSFQNTSQQELIKMLNMYRDNFNIYSVAIPLFYSLDKDIRALIKIHLHVIRRGVAVVHVAHEGKLYSDDPWDVKYNQKIEENWSMKAKSNPRFKPQYHKLTTFRGYLIYNDITDKQREIYEQVKKTKRKALYESEIKKEDGTVGNKWDRIYEMFKEGNIDRDGLLKHCQIEGIKFTNAISNLGTRARDDGTTLGKIEKALQGQSEKEYNNSASKKVFKPDLPY